MTQDKTGPDATPRIGLDLGRQIFDDANKGGKNDQQSGVSDESIRQKAYEIWEREGRGGNPQDHWYRAERELKEGHSERSSATMREAPPAAAAEGAKAVNEQQPAGREGAQKKPRRKRIS